VFALLFFGIGIALVIGVFGSYQNEFERQAVTPFLAMLAGMCLLGSYLLLRRKK
jgi:hypothetical protein